jgi:hypothetical protein
VLIVGGSDGTRSLASWDLIDPVVGEVVASGSLSEARAMHTATLLPDGNVLVAGGQDDAGYAIDTYEIWNSRTSSFMPPAPLGVGRSRHGASLLPGGCVLVAAGGQFFDTPLQGAQVRAPGSEVFEFAALHAEGRMDATTTLLEDNRVLVVGGSNSSGPLASAELLDLADRDDC